jgi:hypothetical protein
VSGTVKAALHAAAGPKVAPARSRTVGWDGRESLWVKAAWAAAFWPLFCAIAFFGVPGRALFFGYFQGSLALSLVFALMVGLSHRPDVRAAVRWSCSVLGTGLLGELLAIALTDRGRVPVLSSADDLSRALAIWLLAIAIYEVAPIIAAASRITQREQRARTLDIGAHLCFAALAWLAYAYDPLSTSSGARWFASPWMAAAIAFPFAAARSTPPKSAALPAPLARESLLWILAIVGWAIVAIIVAADANGLAREIEHAAERGTTPSEGLIWTFPVLSLALSSIAAFVLFARAIRIRRAMHGNVVGSDEDGIRVDCAGASEPLSVAIEAGPIPNVGTLVTLLGVRDRTADVGPFRDGAARWSAHRAWEGAPAELARSLAHRGAAWLVWGAVTQLGLWMLLHA